MKITSVGSGNVSHVGSPAINNHLNHGFVILLELCALGGTSSKSSARQLLFSSLTLRHCLFFSHHVSLSNGFQHINDCVPSTPCGNTSHTQTSIRGNDFGFCAAVRNGCLFFTEQVCDFRICKIHSLTWVLSLTKSAS